MARTAVIAGTATAVSNRVSRRQSEKWSSEDQAQQAAVEPPTKQDNTDNQIAQLEQLAKLKDQGILTQDEFDAKKKQILGL